MCVYSLTSLDSQLTQSGKSHYSRHAVFHESSQTDRTFTIIPVAKAYRRSEHSQQVLVEVVYGLNLER